MLNVLSLISIHISADLFSDLRNRANEGAIIQNMKGDEWISATFAMAPNYSFLEDL